MLTKRCLDFPIKQAYHIYFVQQLLWVTHLYMWYGKLDIKTNPSIRDISFCVCFTLNYKHNINTAFFNIYSLKCLLFQKKIFTIWGYSTFLQFVIEFEDYVYHTLTI